MACERLGIQPIDKVLSKMNEKCASKMLYDLFLVIFV